MRAEITFPPMPGEPESTEAAAYEASDEPAEEDPLPEFGTSPVPGGVGAVTTAVLCKHVIEAAERTVK